VKQRRRWLALVAAVIAVALVVLGGLKVWGLTGTDRKRLESMQEAPAQPAHTEALGDARHYPIDMRPFADQVDAATFADPPFDADGIVQAAYGPTPPSRETTTNEHNPVTAAQYALGCYERYLHGDQTQSEPFLRHAQWLRETMDADGRLEYLFDVPSRSLQAPWISAMAQGQAISVFVRAAELTGDESWLDAAQTAFGPLQLTLDQDGAIFRDGDDLWLEEYPEDPPSHVFNGHVFALFGVRDLALATGDKAADETWRAAADTLAAHLEDFENDGWLRYDLTNGTIASRQYYRIQFDQTALLAEMTGDERFSEAVERWDGPIESPGMWLVGRFFVRGGELIARHLPW